MPAEEATHAVIVVTNTSEFCVLQLQQMHSSAISYPEYAQHLTCERAYSGYGGIDSSAEMHQLTIIKRGVFVETIKQNDYYIIANDGHLSEMD
jgi:hypothetical protein